MTHPIEEALQLALAAGYRYVLVWMLVDPNSPDVWVRYFNDRDSCAYVARLLRENNYVAVDAYLVPGREQAMLGAAFRYLDRLRAKKLVAQENPDERGRIS